MTFSYLPLSVIAYLSSDGWKSAWYVAITSTISSVFISVGSLMYCRLILFPPNVSRAYIHGHTFLGRCYALSVFFRTSTELHSFFLYLHKVFVSPDAKISYDVAIFVLHIPNIYRTFFLGFFWFAHFHSTNLIMQDTADSLLWSESSFPQILHFITAFLPTELHIIRN